MNSKLSKIIASSTLITLMSPIVIQHALADQTNAPVSSQTQTEDNLSQEQKIVNTSNSEPSSSPSISTQSTSVENTSKNESEVTQSASNQKTTVTESTTKQTQDTTKKSQNINLADDVQSSPKNNTNNIQVKSKSNLLGTSLMIRRSSPQEFINQIAATAQTIAQQNGLYASVMIAQAALESGYGGSGLSSAPNFNFFGIKGNYNGQSVTMRTYEDDGKGNMYTINAQFKKYPSAAESLADYAYLLRHGTYWNPNIYSKTWVSNSNSYQDATKALTGTYATDTSYFSKLNHIIEAFNLTQYDSKPSNVTPINSNGNTPTPAPTPTPTNNNTSNQNNGSNTTYTVKSGDSLSTIASKFNTSVESICQLNNIPIARKNLIYVGQVLKLSSSQNNTNTPKPINNKPTPSPAPVQAKPQNNNQNQTVNYTIKSGDSLSTIAYQFHTTVEKLCQLNNIPKSRRNLMYSGQVLKISSNVPNVQTQKPQVKPTPKSVPTPKNNPSPINNKPEPQHSQSYQVHSGDTLGYIASKFHTSISELAKINNIKNPNIISIGQIIKTPGLQQTQAKPVVNRTITNSPQKYKVQAGDTLSVIAAKHGTTLSRLKSINNIANINLIYIGQLINIK